MQAWREPERWPAVGLSERTDQLRVSLHPAEREPACRAGSPHSITYQKYNCMKSSIKLSAVEPFRCHHIYAARRIVRVAKLSMFKFDSELYKCPWKSLVRSDWLILFWFLCNLRMNGTPARRPKSAFSETVSIFNMFYLFLLCI